MKQFQAITTPVKGYYLETDQYDGFLSVILPQAADNLLINPILEVSGVSPKHWGVNGAVSSFYEDGGPFWKTLFTYNIPNNAYVFSSTPETLNGTYTLSFWVRSDESAKFSISASFTTVLGPTVKTSSTFVANRQWEQYSFTFDTEGLPGKNVTVRLNGKDNLSLQIGAAQLEAGKYPTTLIHGYLGKGYKWLGVPFDSVARRDISVIDGGRKINLKQLGMKLTSIEGLGLPDMEHVTTPLAFQQGSLFDCTTLKERDFEMSFVLNSLSLKDLLCARNAVGRAIFSLNQERCFIWQPIDCGVPLCDEVKFTAVYSGGFSLGLTSHFGEEIKLSFTGYDIAMKQGLRETVVLNPVEDISHTAIVGVDEYGNTQVLPPFTGISTSIYTVKQAVISPYDGNLYIAVSEGTFPPLRGMILRYDGSSWVMIAYSAYGGTYTALHADGKYLYVGVFGAAYTVVGASPFTGTSGIGIARINLATQQVENIGAIKNTSTIMADQVSSASPKIQAFATAKDGTLFVGGNFTGFNHVNGNTTTWHVAAYKPNENKWYNLNIGLTNYWGNVRTLYYDESTKRLYLGGDFWNTNWTLISAFATFCYIRFDSLGVAAGGNAVRTDFPVHMTAFPGHVMSIVKYKNRIVMGGRFRSTFSLYQGLLENLAYFDPEFRSGSNVSGSIFPLGGRTNGWGVDSEFMEDACDAVAQPYISCSLTPIYDLTVCDDVLYIAGKFEYYGYRSSVLVFNRLGYACGAAKYISTGQNAEVGVMLPDIEYAYYTSFTHTQCLMTGIACGSEKLGIKRFYTTFVLFAAETGVISRMPIPKKIKICDNDLPTEPIIFVTGPGKLLEISNQNNNTSLYFDYTLTVGETLIIDLNETPTKIYSTIYDDITYSLLPASTPASFKLNPGINSLVSKFAMNTETSTTSTFLNFQRKALAAESLCCDCPE